MKRKVVMLLLCFGIACTIAACGSKDAAPADAVQDKVTEQKEKTNDTEKETPEQVESTENEEKTEPKTQQQAENELYQKIDGMQFVFSSGAGGWATCLEVRADGSFVGDYHDSEMGLSQEGYEYGTCYACDFKGKFDTPVKVNDHTYSTKVIQLEMEKEAGTSEIIDQVKYEYTDPYGINLGQEILIYLPSTPVSELSEDVKVWMRCEAGQQELEKYALYNVEDKEAFAGESKEVSDAADEEASTAEGIDAELAQINAKDQEIDERYKQEDLTQSDLNELSYERYELWDNELNSIWKRLKDKLRPDEMDVLIKEEKEWILYKNREAEAAGKEEEKGTMQFGAEDEKAAELTKKRVYELIEKLR